MVVPFTGSGDAEEGTALGLLDQESSLVINEGCLSHKEAIR